MAAGLEIHHKRDFRGIRWLFWIVFVGILAVTIWFAYSYFTKGDLPPFVDVKALRADPRIDESPVTEKQITEYTVPKINPRYISIPSLGVGNTRVMSVGVTANNQLDTPKNISDAAWYNKSARPGAGYGAVLIDGHNGGITRNGVFAKIGTLQKGAEIIVERGDGKKFTYKVVENQSMALDEVNKTGMKMMMQSADETKEGLNLITCDGKWVPKYQQFDRRIMLRAVRV
ncbi:MAG TPA: class F sortase [Candidatus Saccharimonadales bacterium]